MGTMAEYPRLQLTPELQSKINNALEEKHPLVLAVVDATGQPHLSLRGSLQTYSETQLGRKGGPGRKGGAIIIELTWIEGVLGFGPDGPIWCRMAADVS